MFDHTLYFETKVVLWGYCVYWSIKYVIARVLVYVIILGFHVCDLFLLPNVFFSRRLIILPDVDPCKSNKIFGTAMNLQLQTSVGNNFACQNLKLKCD